MGALRELLVSFDIAVDDAPLKAVNGKIDATINKLKKFGKAIAGAFAAKQVFNFVEGQVALGAELQHQADLLGLSTKALEQWRYAASFADISGEELQGMFMRVSRAALQGAEATGKHGAAMKKLTGEVKPTDSVADVFEKIGTKLAGMKDGFEKTALAAKFFGRTDGLKVLELFKDGADGIAKYREEFELLGGGMGDFPKKSKEVEQSQKRLDFVWGTLKSRIAGVFLPALKWVVDELAHLGAAFIKLTDGTEVLGTAMVVLGALAVAQAIRIVAAYLPVILPFLLWAAAIAAVILVGEDLAAFFEGRGSLIGEIIESLFGKGSSDQVRAWFQGAKQFASEAFDFIKSIIGDTSKTSQEKFQAILDFLSGAFRSAAKKIFGDVAGDVITEMLGASVEVIKILDHILEVVAKVSKAVGKAVGAAAFKVVDKVADVAAKDNADIQNKPIAPDSSFAIEKKPFYLRAIAAITGITDKDVIPTRIPLPPSAAPVGAVGGDTIVTNNFTIAPGTPQAQQRAVASAAERGTKAGIAAPNRAAAAALGRTK